MNTTLFCPGPTHTEFLQNAFTGNRGEKYNIPTRPTDNRMTAERCAALLAIAIANKCHLNFVGTFPSSPLTYITCFYPNLSKMYVTFYLPVANFLCVLFLRKNLLDSFILKSIFRILFFFGKSGLTKFREGNSAAPQNN